MQKSQLKGLQGETEPATRPTNAAVPAGGAFSPVSRSYSKVIANKTNQNYTWTAPAAPPAPQTLPAENAW